MANRHYGQYIRFWWWTHRQLDICNSRVAFRVLLQCLDVTSTLYNHQSEPFTKIFRFETIFPMWVSSHSVMFSTFISICAPWVSCTMRMHTDYNFRPLSRSWFKWDTFFLNENQILDLIYFLLQRILNWL